MTSQSLTAFLPVNRTCTPTICSLIFPFRPRFCCRRSPPLPGPTRAHFDADFNPLSCVRHVREDGSHLWFPCSSLDLWVVRPSGITGTPRPFPGTLPGARLPASVLHPPPLPQQPLAATWPDQLEAGWTWLLWFRNASLKLFPDIEEVALVRRSRLFAYNAVQTGHIKGASTSLINNSKSFRGCPLSLYSVPYVILGSGDGDGNTR